MGDELIDDDTLDSLPDDPGLAFVMFERACRTSLREAIEREDNGNVVSALQLDFMHDVIAAAQFYQIPDIKDFILPSTRNFPWEVYEDFSRRIRFFTTHYRLAARGQRNRYSVELQGSHKDRIRTLVAHLKLTIDQADMPDWRKNRLRKSIDDFEKALDAKRLNLTAAMIFLGVLAAGCHDAGQAAEGLGKVVHEITIAIGQSKDVEDTTKVELPPPVKPPVYLIEKKPADEPPQFDREQLDDEIPF